VAENFMGLFNKLRLLVTVVLCSSTLSSCVYYNNFFNAKKRYNEAEQRRAEAENAPDNQRNTRAIYAYRELYMKVIRKASIVLDRHPDSKWVDDSLLLIGKCFYWRGGYKDALLKFQELQENFPNSEHIAESLYWQGRSLRAYGKLDEARAVLGYLSTAKNPSFSGRAQLALAELESHEGNYEAAIEAYLKLLSQKDKNIKSRVWDGLGGARYQLEQYDKALLAYRKVLKTKSSLKENYETRLQIARILERQMKLDDALKVYNDILKEKLLKSFGPAVQIKRGHVYDLKGDLPRAIEIYEKVIEDHARTDESAEAYYRMGLIEQKQRKDLVKARELFEEARKQKPGSEAGILARELERNLSDLKKYRKTAEKNNKRSLDAMFNMAQLYLFNLAEPDSALACYRKALAIADTTESELAPKALYAIGLVYADTLKNEGEATKAFQELVDTYPVSSYAIMARNRLEGTRSDDALAEARFLEAEALRVEGASAEDYLDILRKLPGEYPNSIFAPRALYAVGFAYETSLANLDTARTYYERLVQHYPMTDFAETAGQKLDSKLLEPESKEEPEKAGDPAEGKAETTETLADDKKQESPQSPESEPAKQPEQNRKPEKIESDGKAGTQDMKESPAEKPRETQAGSDSASARDVKSPGDLKRKIAPKGEPQSNEVQKADSPAAKPAETSSSADSSAASSDTTQSSGKNIPKAPPAERK